MTREEAIKYLIQPVATSTVPSNEFVKQMTAWSMAVRALNGEPKHGRWEKDGEIMMFGDIPVKCSQCGFKTLQDAAHRMDYHYCPNCGARMDEVDNG